MELIIWGSYHSVNIAKLDDQHKELFKISNKLYKAMREGHGKDILNNIFFELTNYTQFHFAQEESYFEKFQYPDFELHKAEHDKLSAKVNELNEKHKNGNLILTTEVLQFLIRWVDNHILGADKKYTDFLNSAGLV
jgi:hemerythrin